MKPLALLPRLRLSAYEASLYAPSVSVHGGQLQSQLLVPPLGNDEGLAGLCVKVIREPRLVTSVIHPLLGCENLLDGLRKGNKNTP